MQSGLTNPSPRSEHSALLAEEDLERGRYTNSQTAPSGNAKSLDSHKSFITNSTWQKVQYYLPATAWLPAYSMSMLTGDFLAGMTVASILIPQSISYATSLAKLSPLAGLYSAAIPGVVYALLGTSRQLNVAPEAALSLLIGQAVSGIMHDDPHTHPSNPDAVAIAITTITTLQVGLFSFLLGLLRLGFMDVVLSRALLRGFVTAIAVVIMIEQLIPMLGLAELEHQLNPQTTIEKFIFLVENAATHEHRPTTIISFGSLLILILARNLKNSRFGQKFWFFRRIPEVFVVVVISTILSDELRWDDLGVAILGKVPIKSAGSFFRFPLHRSTVGYLQSTTSTAVLIAVIGYLDSVVAAKQNADRFGYAISPNRELVALGASNIVAAFVPGSLPAFGSITRSRINADVGGRTQMASLICSAFVLLATFFVLPALYYLPRCVLAAVIALIVFSLLAEAPHDLTYFWRMRAYSDFALMTVTFVCTIFWNVEVGVACSIVLSLLLVVHKSSKPKMTVLGRMPGTNKWKPIADNPEAEEEVLHDSAPALIVRLNDSLDFANTAQLKQRLRRLELYGEHTHHPSEAPRREPASVLVFHMADVETCDACAAQILLEALTNYKSRGTQVFLTHLRPAVEETFERAGIITVLGRENVCRDVSEAIGKASVGPDSDWTNRLGESEGPGIFDGVRDSESD